MVIGVVAAVGVAVGQPALEPAPVPPGLVGSGAPTPAGSSAVESSDVPAYAAGPDRFAVVPFENRSGVRAFDWLVAAAPFEIADKTQAVLRLEPTDGPLFVGTTAVPAVPQAIAAFAAPRAARWVIGGWVERPSWELQLAITIWKVEAGTATLVHEATRRGPVPTYHALLGQALAEAWSKAGKPVDAGRAQRLERAIAIDLYAVHLMGRGLGHLVGALPPPASAAASTDPTAARTAQLRLAEHDLERAVFIDPKCAEAQRLVGELYLALAVARDEPKRYGRAAGKFAYAHDLAPDDPSAIRAAGLAAARSNKHEVARELFTKLVTQRPWDLAARYQLGAALWATGRIAAAERQLQQVTARDPDHLPSRRVLVLIHAANSDTARLAKELEAIAARAPDDLEVKADLATAYGALGRWDRATEQLEAIAAARAPELALLVRIGDGHRRQKALDAALAWYARAAKVAPESSLPGFATAQALYDAGKLAEAGRAYNLLQKYRDDLPAAEQALGVIAYRGGRANEAAWYLRRATREGPRRLRSWRALIAAELLRKDAPTALAELEPALRTWPGDGHLHYLAAVAHSMQGEREVARDQLIVALARSPELAPARAALGALDAGGAISLAYQPEIVRPWGDAEAVAAELGRFAQTAASMATVRMGYQAQFLALLGMLGKGPYAPIKRPQIRTCPVARVAPAWAAAQQELRTFERLGVDLEAAYRYLARHDEANVTAGLLPNARTQLALAKKTYRTSLGDIAELRAQWSRGLGPELRLAGCTDKLLAAAVADPDRYRVIVDDRPDAVPEHTAARPRPRATFYVDNTGCVDPVDVWIDGSQLGQVAPGRRSALVADGGERTLCLLGPGAAQCGDRGTVRQVYLHDGWSVTMHCPK